MIINKPRKKILWIYDDMDHTVNPILLQAITTLNIAASVVYILDFAEHVSTGDYTHIPLRKYSRMTSLLIKMLKRIQKSSIARKTQSSMSTKEVQSISLPDIFLLCKAIYVSIFIHPDVIVFSKPTLGSIVALLLSRLYKTRLVYYPFELYGEQHFQVPQLWKKNELKLLKSQIDALITQNQSRADFYVKKRHSRVTPYIVHNYKTPNNRLSKGRLHQYLKIPNDIKVVLYEGHLIQGRWLKELVESTRFFHNKAMLVFVGNPTNWWEENISPILQNKKYSQKIKILAWMNKKKLYATIPDADVGVIIYDDKRLNNLYCEPGKLSDYILCGIPVIVPNFPSIATLVKRLKIGNIFYSSKPKEIAASINRVMSKSRKEWDNTISPAKKELTWATQQKTLLVAVLGK